MWENAKVWVNMQFNAANSVSKWTFRFGLFITVNLEIFTNDIKKPKKSWVNYCPKPIIVIGYNTCWKMFFQIYKHSHVNLHRLYTISMPEKKQCNINITFAIVVKLKTLERESIFIP